MKRRQLEEIREGAFAQCTSSTTIELPNSISIIRKGAFEDCTNLQIIRLGNAIEEIDDHAFDRKGGQFTGDFIFSIPTALLPAADLV